MRPEKGLPCNLSAERFVLGSILLDDAAYIQSAGKVSADDFSVESHRRIFARMGEIQERGEKIDRVTLANELMKRDQLESCGGLSYLVSLDDGLPQNANPDSYIRIVKDKALGRRLIFACQHAMNRAVADNEEPQAVISDIGETLLRLGSARDSDALISTAEIIDKYPGGINALLSPEKRGRGIPTGFPMLDEMTGGLEPGELFLLAARPSMGKTSWALNVAANIGVRQQKPVGIFSLEMSKESLIERLIVSEARVDSQAFKHGRLTGDQRRALQMATSSVSRAPIFIDDSSAVNVMDINAKARLLKAEHGLSLVIVDYIQLMAGRGNNRNEEVGGISRGLKLMAKGLGVPVLALSQLSRASETRAGDHRPQLSDLRDSGSLEADADKVAFIYREEVYKKDREDLRGLAELLLLKARNGPVGKVDLVFLSEFTRFENRARDIDMEEMAA